MRLDRRPGSKPVYQQLADLLRAEITSGALRPGGRLPTEAQLEHDYEVGVGTVKKALAVLRREGLVLTDRSGSIVREPLEYAPVEIDSTFRVRARMPTDPERRVLDMDEGVPLLVVIRPGAPEEIYPADRFEAVGSVEPLA